MGRTGTECSIIVLRFYRHFKEKIMAMNNNNDSSIGRTIFLAVVAIVVIAAVIYLMQPQDTPLQRAGNEISEGVEDAGRALDPNPTVGERVGGAIEDTGENIQDATE
jgi:hypothetical protein